MPALHIHDVARIAYGVMVEVGDGPQGWAAQDEARRERWRTAVQMAMDDDSPPLGIEDEIGWDGSDLTEFVDIVNACRPFVED